jgi:glycerol kinase
VIVLGLDQGTSSTRCVALDRDLRERGSASVAVASQYPGPGLVEQDPDELASSAQGAIAGALAIARAGPGDVAAVGIANQTETFVVWERASGRPIHPAIVWQDRRTDAACAQLRAAGHAALVRERSGLELDATFPATKLAWLLDHVPGARADAEAGRLAYGDVASWLLHRLAGIHVTDAGNAGRSLLCPLGGVEWDDALLDLFGVPRALLPPIVDSDGVSAPLDEHPPPGGLPVRAVVGDQQASLFGLRCWTTGSAKVTLGTGAFVLVHAGETAPRPPAGVLASCAWRRGGGTSFALEGFVPAAGAATDWFARIGAIGAGSELDPLLHTAGADEVVCVPALQGFGTPSWNAGARGALLGVGLGTTRADIARAVVDGVLHQVADALDAIGGTSVVRLDGGLSRSAWITQRLADLAGVRVERAARPDSTAIGAATLAGLAAGVWDAPASLPPIAFDLAAEPALAAGERDRLRERWSAARSLVAGWR